MHLDDLTRKFSGTREDQGKAIFSTLFIAGNRLQTLFDSHIPELSLKQFMLLSMVRQSEEPLTFTQLGSLLGCSRQNIKKLADVLEKKGFIALRQSPGTPGPCASAPPGKRTSISGKISPGTGKSCGISLRCMMTEKWRPCTGC